MGSLIATSVWRTTAELVIALDSRLGEPVDAYVNGSQVWLRDDGPGGVALEWRLHPVPGYARPKGMGTYDVFSRVALALAEGTDEATDPSTLWDGLECFAAYEDEIEPAVLATCAQAIVGLAPDAVGLVDHEPIGLAWEQSGRRTSIIGAVLAQLGGPV